MVAGRLATGPNVRVITPQGYRTTLALQLHAAAVLTDSGGVQRESAWLDVPCLVLRSATEWVEAVAGSRGRIRVVGVDLPAVLDALADLEPLRGAEAEARMRAVQRVIAPAGAPVAIVAALFATPAMSAGSHPSITEVVAEGAGTTNQTTSDL
jgi:UDP-N-acetylglucosamine 2-epimerase